MKQSDRLSSERLVVSYAYNKNLWSSCHPSGPKYFVFRLSLVSDQTFAHNERSKYTVHTHKAGWRNKTDPPHQRKGDKDIFLEFFAQEN